MLQVIDDSSKYSYQKRVSSIYGMGILHKTMKDKGPVNQLIKNQVLPLLEDPLRNLRYVAVKVLKEIAKETKKKELKEAIRKKFKEMLVNEHDKEICFIAHLD